MRVVKHLFVVAAAVLMAGCQSMSVKSNDPDMPANAYLEGNGATVGIVLCHGRGQYPTWLVVDPLRKGINQQLGYHTLSIQMPTADVNWREYQAFFPEAHKRIAAAVRHLKEVNKVNQVYLMGHSMGSRMTTAFLAANPDADIAGFIGIGIRNGGGAPLDSDANLREVNIPVLDIYGDGGDGKDASHAATRADMVGKNYQQVLIPGADHKFTRHDNELVLAVLNWLKQQQAN